MSGDPNDMFSRMFASFVNRKNRGSSSSGPTPPPPPEPLHRTTSEHRSSSRSRPRGIAALLSPGAARTPTRSPFHSSSSNRNSGAAAAAAAAAANQLSGQSSSHQHASHQPGHGPPPSQGHRGYQDYEPGSYGRGSTRGGGLFSPLNRGSAGAGPSRRQTGKLSEKTASTDEDHPPRKRSRTHIVRSQSAHAGSLHGSSRSQDKSKTRFERRRRVSPAEASVDAIMPRASPTPPKTPAGGKSFPCPQCDSHFQQRGQLARHTRRVHEKLRPHACEHCGRLFGARSDRTRHIQIIHNKVRDFSCDICLFKFQAKTHLEAHIRTVHQGERPYTCSQCGFSFGLRSNLLTHQRTVHHKEAKWRCPVCNKAFNRKHDKDRHMKLVHEPSMGDASRM